MLTLSSTFPTTLTIDEGTIALAIKRLDPEEFDTFEADFDRMGRESVAPDDPAEEASAREKRHRVFVRDAVRRYVTLPTGQIEDDGKPVTDGDGLIRAFAGRPWVLAKVLALIRLENTISQPDRDFRRATLAPFVPTPPEVIDAMLDAGQVGEGQTVIDIGCGEGALLVAAAKRGAKAIGYELHRGRAREALKAAADAGVSSLVHVHSTDVSKLPADVFRAATVVTLYLLPKAHEAIGETLRTALLPGARVICHAYQLGEGWTPVSTSYTPEPAVVVAERDAAQKAIRDAKAAGQPIDGLPLGPPRRLDSAGWVYVYEVK